MSRRYVFPLNPTWVLRDEGWHDVYAALLGSRACQPAMDAWLPPSSGLRERIEAIHAAHPRGFVRSKPTTPTSMSRASSAQAERSAPPPDGRTAPTLHERKGEEAFERADLELRRYKTFKRAKLKMRAILLWNEAEKRAHPLRNFALSLLEGPKHLIGDTVEGLSHTGEVLSHKLEELTHGASELASAGIDELTKVGRTLQKRATMGACLLQDTTAASTGQLQRAATAGAGQLQRTATAGRGVMGKLGRRLSGQA